jgi:HEAT repeat protein
MLSRKLFTMLALVTLAGLQPILASGEFPPSISESLRRHNIQLTQSALLDALRNADPEVRDLAAQKLAEDKVSEAIPAIKDALASEKVPSTRMNIAFALAELGESTGLDTLEDNCRNRNLAADIRTQSAEYMLNLNHGSTVCLSAILDVLESGSNGYKMQAATLLPQFRNLSEQDSERVFVGLVKALHASYALVRLEAGRALADLGDRRGIPELRDAIEAEQEQDIRPRLEEDLGILRNKIR